MKVIKIKMEDLKICKRKRIGTWPSGRRIDLDTMYNTVRWVENFDKTHSEGCNKKMNIILGTQWVGHL
jgi:hypothetical protein